MIEHYEIADTSWTPITAAGQSGTCWLDETDSNASGSMDVRIIHSSSGTPTVADFSKGKRVYKPKGNVDVLDFTADLLTDIYYARCRNGTAKIAVDAI